MADANSDINLPGGNTLSAAGARVLDNLAELEPALVNAGIFDQDGQTVALTCEEPSWGSEARTLLEALKTGSEDEEFDSAHIAEAEGEVFVVSEQELSMVAVTGRFVLASLTSYDMRMALRDLLRVKHSSRAENVSSSDA